jgi:hypothetical protein
MFKYLFLMCPSYLGEKEGYKTTNVIFHNLGYIKGKKEEKKRGELINLDSVVVFTLKAKKLAFARSSSGESALGMRKESKLRPKKLRVLIRSS